MDIEKDFVIVKARLYLGAAYDLSPKKAEAHKQGHLTELDRVETKAKARAARDFGIGTEHALDMDDLEAGAVEGSVEAPKVRVVNADKSSQNAQQNGNGATTQPTPAKPTPIAVQPQHQGIDAPTPGELRTRCKAIGKDFSVLVKMLKKVATPDDALSPEDCTRASVMIAQWEGFFFAAKEQNDKVAANGSA
jgi:hypothetical protein